MITVNLPAAAADERDDGEPQVEPGVLIEVPVVGHDEAQNASDLVEIIREKYGITDEDLDTLYNGMISVFVRGKQLAKN